MLTTARGVTLGLGKINLGQLNSQTRQRAAFNTLKRNSTATEDLAKPKFIIKKHVDRKTLWAACRTTVLGSIVIVVGILMTAFGYFHSELSQEERFDKTRRRKDVPVETKQFLLRSLHFFGPILMAVGAFMLIAACVITLENRDSHARIIYGELNDERKRNKRKSDSEVSLATPRKLTFEEIRNWRPRRCRISRLRSTEVKLLEKRRVLSVSCLPMLFQTADTKELYESLLHDYKNSLENESEGIEEGGEQHENGDGDEKPASATVTQNLYAKENVVAEVHADPDDSDDSLLSATSSVSGKVQLPSQEDICSVMSRAQMELYDLDEASFEDELPLVIRKDIASDDMTLSPHSSFSKTNRPKSACCANACLTVPKYDPHDLYYRFFSLPDFRNKQESYGNSLVTASVDKSSLSIAR